MTRPKSRLLALGTKATVAGQVLAIVRRAGTEASPIVRFEGIEDRAAIEALRGEEILVAETEMPALGEGEWWAHELEGCTVVARDERVLGVVRRLIELPSCEALEVASGQAGAEPLLVPMVKDAVVSVAVAERRIIVDAAFLDLAGTPPEDAA